MLKFDEKLHRYYDEHDNTYISCTQLIEHYVPKFDKEFWLYYKVLQDKMGFSNTDEGKKMFSRWLTKGFGFSFKKKNIKDLCIKNAKSNL